MKLIIKTTKCSFLALAMTFMFGHSDRVISQNTEVFVSSGEVLASNPLTISVGEGLSIGREWAVFDLKANKYLGRGIVFKRDPANNTADCSFKERSQLSFKGQNKFSGDVLLIRPIPKDPSEVKINEGSCSQLPSLLKEAIYKSRNGRSLSLTNCYNVDLDSNNFPDIVHLRVATRTGYFTEVHLISQSGWVRKFVSGCEDNT